MYQVFVELRKSPSETVVEKGESTDDKGVAIRLLNLAQDFVLNGRFQSVVIDSKHVIVLRINRAKYDLTLVDLPGLNYAVRNIFFIELTLCVG